MGRPYQVAAWAEAAYPCCGLLGTLRAVIGSAAGTWRVTVSALAILLAAACAPGDGREMRGASPTDTAGVLTDDGARSTAGAAGHVSLAPVEGAPKVHASEMDGQVTDLANYDLSYPQISGTSFDSAVNGALEAVVAAAYTGFRASVLEEEGSEMGASSLRGTGKVLHVDGRLLSVVFDVTTEWDDAASLQQDVATLLVDLSTGRVLEPAELFVAGSPWLDQVAALARADLSAQLGEDMLFTEGLAADAANFRHLAVTASGLVLRFDAYQVAPGVAGTPWVDLPWSAVASLVDRTGPAGHLVS